MAEHLAQQPREEVPRVARPHLPGAEAPDQLPDHRLDAAACVDESPRPWPALTRSLAEGGLQSQAFAPESLHQRRAPVVEVSERVTRHAFEQVCGGLQLVDVRRGDLEADYPPRPADPQGGSHAEAGLLRHLVEAVGGEFAQSAASLRAGEAADRQGEAVHEREAAVELQAAQESPPEPCLHLPEVGCLPRKSRAVDAPQRREEVRVVATEVGEDGLLLVEAEELADGLHRQHFRVAERRVRAAPAQTPAGEFSRQCVVVEAEDCYNERVQVHGSPPYRERQTLPLKAPVAWTSTFSKN